MKALVIGGTGPSGPHLVNGLLARGYEVTVLHGGFHEVEFAKPVRHIHTDPHFIETLEQGLGDSKFDLAIATYGRIRLAAQVLKGRTKRLLTVSGAGVYAFRPDPRWGLMPPLLIPETAYQQDDPDAPTTRRMSYLIWLTEQEVIKAHKEGHYEAAVFRYPGIYGPYAPADSDWSIVRRILDGRKQIILGNGGLNLQSRAFGANAAHAVLCAVDRPKEAAGQIFNVADATPVTLRQRVEVMAHTLGHQWEIVDMPSSLARQVAPALGGGTEQRLFDLTKIRTLLGYKDAVPVMEAVEQSARWLVDHRPEPGGELEQQLPDPFDYTAEDALLRIYKEGMDRASQVKFREVETSHMYRHPTKPGETWAPASERKRARQESGLPPSGPNQE